MEVYTKLWTQLCIEILFTIKLSFGRWTTLWDSMSWNSTLQWKSTDLTHLNECQGHYAKWTGSVSEGHCDDDQEMNCCYLVRGGGTGSNLQKPWNSKGSSELGWGSVCGSTDVTRYPPDPHSTPASPSWLDVAWGEHFREVGVGICLHEIRASWTAYAASCGLTIIRKQES